MIMTLVIDIRAEIFYSVNSVLVYQPEVNHR
jgi:hypothetical protein